MPNEEVRVRPDPPPPGTWRRDDGQASFCPKGEVIETWNSAPPAVPVAPPAPVKPVGPEMAPCPYCSTFEYEVVEGIVPQSILDHLQAAHPAIWAQMQRGVAEAMEKVETEFT